MMIRRYIWVRLLVLEVGIGRRVLRFPVLSSVRLVSSFTLVPPSPSVPVQVEEDDPINSTVISPVLSLRLSRF